MRQKVKPVIDYEQVLKSVQGGADFLTGCPRMLWQGVVQ
jgi:hypothetical protein